MGISGGFIGGRELYNCRGMVVVGDNCFPEELIARETGSILE